MHINVTGLFFNVIFKIRVKFLMVVMSSQTLNLAFKRIHHLVLLIVLSKLNIFFWPNPPQLLCYLVVVLKLLIVTDVVWFLGSSKKVFSKLFPIFVVFFHQISDKVYFVTINALLFLGRKMILLCHFDSKWISLHFKIV